MRSLQLLLLLGLASPALAAAPMPDTTAAGSFNTSLANESLNFAWAANCNASALETWSCEWCAKTSLRLQSYLRNASAGTQGYVAVDEIGRRIVISFRGSDNTINWIEDFLFWLTDLHPDSDIKVERGFLNEYNSLRNRSNSAIAAARASCGEDCPLLFTGHSLGAAMATIGAAVHAAAGADVHLHTFGCPRVGNAAFASWLGGLLAPNGRSGGVGRRGGTRTHTSFRMRRQKDMVPSVPPRSFGFHHVATEVWDTHNASDAGPEGYVVCDGSGEDPACGDSEESPPFPLYLAHLSGVEHCLYMGYKGCDCEGGPPIRRLTVD